MPELAATGPQGTAIHKLVSLIAADSAFQTRTGAADSTEAEAKHIYWPWLQNDDGREIDVIEATRPFVLIEQADYTWDLKAGGAQNYFLPYGSLLLTISDNDKFVEDYKSDWTDFINFCDDVLQAIIDGAALSDALAVVEIKQARAAMLNPENQWQDCRYWCAAYRVDWNPI